ncbi:MAG: cupin domain-containing protein, partial [Burkholderiaceae bacterium]
PGAGQAASFVSRGFLWNAGMVCATPRVILREMAAHCPGLLESVRESVAKASAPHGPGRVELARTAYERAPEVSFDVAVLERAQHLAIVRCGESLGWSDAGSWGEMASRLPRDAGGNHAEGETLLVDSRNSQVHAGSRLVAMLGVEDLLVVDTPDALLIADRSRAAEVKQIHTRLRARGHEAASAHRAVHRPWGVYTVLTQGPRYKVKHIAVKPGAALSLQAHAHRSEHWVVLQGVAQVEKDGELRRYAAGESAAIPAGCRHRLSNPSDNELQLIEVQTGSYVGEDDITRFSDAYGRP